MTVQLLIRPLSFAVADKTKAKVDLLSQLNQHSYLAAGNIQTPSVWRLIQTIQVLQIVFGSNLDVAELRARVEIGARTRLCLT